MKKSSLVGIEVYYEEKPEPAYSVGYKSDVGGKGTSLDEGVWVFGSPEEEEDEDLRFDDEYIEEITMAFEQVHSPTVGKIYKVKGLPICVKYKGEVFTPLMKDKILAVAYHDAVFYIDAENLNFASDREATQYLEEDD